MIAKPLHGRAAVQPLAAYFRFFRKVRPSAVIDAPERPCAGWLTKPALTSSLAIDQPSAGASRP